MEISQILNKIDEHQLFVPAFQREYVWKRDDAKKLMDSLIKDYPTGTMLTWETNQPPELKGDWKYHPQQGAVKLILDGQQRITTLYMLIRGEYPPYYTPEEITHDTRNLYVNVDTLELEYYSRITMENKPLWQNLTSILQRQIRTRNVIRELQQIEEVSEELENRIDDNFRAIESIPSKEFLEQEIPVKASIKEAIDIFYIVNASGVNLTDAELALAQISGYWPEAREVFKSKLSKLEASGFVFKLDFLVYVVLGILHHIGSDMKRLHSPDNLPAIKQTWERLDQHVLDHVMNIMKTHAYVDHTKEINSVYALVPIIVYCFNKGQNQLSQSEIKKIVKWFYYSQLRNRYISQLPQKLDRDVGIICKSENPFDELLNALRAERPLQIAEDEFVGVITTRNPLWPLMCWYFKSRNAVCFTTGVGIRQNLGSSYSLEWDHIFAYSVLKEAGYNPDNRSQYSMIQELTNRAVLTQTANRSKSNKLAEVYLANIDPDALRRQAIPLDPELWKLENFERFLEQRRRILAGELNAFLEGITETMETDVETSVEQFIAEGESGDLEFKSSFRWNFRDSCFDRRLEDVIMKSIAAMSNGEGGILLIGVDDEGVVLGLEDDYATLNGDNDEFELHLRNLVNSNFSPLFSANNLKVTFPTFEDKEVCRVDVKAASSPQYLTVSDRNGVKSDKFYLRSGNSSVELPLRDVAEYCRTRF